MSTRRRETKADRLDARAKFFRGLGDPARLAILMSLRTGPRSAGDLARECDLSPSNASNHLQCLLGCGLVSLEPRGRQNVYHLADSSVSRLLDESERLMCSRVGSLIEACRHYGASSRRALRTSSRRGGGTVADPRGFHNERVRKGSTTRKHRA